MRPVRQALDDRSYQLHQIDGIYINNQPNAIGRLTCLRMFLHCLVKCSPIRMGSQQCPTCVASYPLNNGWCWARTLALGRDGVQITEDLRTLVAFAPLAFHGRLEPESQHCRRKEDSRKALDFLTLAS